VYKWYCVQCCIAALHTVSFIPADLKRFFVSAMYMSRWSRKS
jgi:hypothetical protein